MNYPQSVNPNYAIGLPLALFFVWMQRNKRWTLMLHTMDLSYKIRSVS